MLIFGIVASALVKLRTTLLKTVWSKLLINLTILLARDINMVFLGEKPVDGVTRIIASSGHKI